jgi:Amt family ammonium transporter
MACNGLLAGLVSVTAPVGAISTRDAVLVGAVGGALVVLAVRMFDRLKVDDPVGAISVHAICGTWGTFSVALFAQYDDAFLGREDAGLFYGGGLDQMATQVTFIVAHAAFVLVTTGILFSAIKATIGLRVTPEEEIAGLDIEEHGAPGYGPDILAGIGMPSAAMKAHDHIPSVTG